MAKVLVEVGLKQRLSESLEIVVGEKNYKQVLDYIKIPL
jgi:hypothetical protein